MARFLDRMTDSRPSSIGRGDVLAANPLGQALYAPIFDEPSRPANFARFDFLSPRARTSRPNGNAPPDTVAMMRTGAGRDPYDKALTDLVGELSTRSEEFRIRWGAHDVRLHRTGIKHIHHPVVGEMNLYFEVMELTAEPGPGLGRFQRRSRLTHQRRPPVPRQLGCHPRASRRPGDAEPNVVPQSTGRTGTGGPRSDTPV